MARTPENARTIGLVGAGTIGSGWAAHFLARGLDVVVVDPGAGAADVLHAKVRQAWPSLKTLGLADGASPDRLVFRDRIDDALAAVDFVQESAPERVETKKTVLHQVTQVVRPDVVVASSTSYFMPSDLQVFCKYPDRFVVGHPFHPVYLLPLVEVVGGRDTAVEAIERAMGFYAYWGHEPLHCRREVPGHLGNRLQRALFAEALRLVADGVATTAEVDAALTRGAGLRLSLFGPFMTRAMAGGGAGPGTVFGRQRASGVVFPFERDNPDLAGDLLARVTANMADQLQGHDTVDLEAARDAYLVALRKLRNATGWPDAAAPAGTA